MENSLAQQPNVPYILNPPLADATTKFSSIRRMVTAEDYYVDCSRGITEPGLFITFGGAGRVVTHGREAGRTFQLTSGKLLFWDRGVPLDYRCEKGGCWNFFFIHFIGLQMLRELRLECGRVYETKQTDHIVRICESVIQMLIGRPIGFAYSADQAFRDILIKLAREREQNSGANHGAIEEVLAFIHQSVGSSLSVDQLVRRSDMSRSKFFNAFKLATGLSPHAYILRLKLEAAKLALETTRRSIRSIAGSLGFSDEYSFSKTFRKSVGMPPAAYRRLHQCGGVIGSRVYTGGVGEGDTNEGETLGQ